MRAAVSSCGQDIAFWWRDDDLVCNSAGLQSLSAIGRRTGVEPLVAIIPGHADAELGGTLAALDSRPWFAQHGFVHANHEQQGGVPSEFDAGRLAAPGLKDIAEGRAILLAMGLPRFLDVFVPPWNHLHPGFLPLLPRLGFSGVSGYVGHTDFSDEAAGQVGLAVGHTAVEVTRWGARPQMVELDRLMANMAELIQASTAPLRIGILTHHRVMQEEEFGALEALFDTISATPGSRWLTPPDVFA